MASPLASLCVVTVLLLGTGSVANAAASPLPMAERHEQWMAVHGIVYRSEAEKARRLEIFERNVDYVESFNRAGGRSYTLGVNQFADMTDEEYAAAYARCVLIGRAPATPPSSAWRAWLMNGENKNNTGVVPPAIDWRAQGAVTAVKSQRNCGACWAFAAVAAMEGVVKIKTGKLVELSVQEVVDCDRGGRDVGCTGGNMDEAFKFIIRNGGLTTEASHPYTAHQSPCNATTKAFAAAKIGGFRDVPNDQAALLRAVAGQPVAVGIDNRGPGFRFYSRGVYSGPCGSSVHHALAAVGYGATTDGKKYWVMKNSWGGGWGEGGYMRIARGDDGPGICAITSMSSYPTV